MCCCSVMLLTAGRFARFVLRLLFDGPLQNDVHLIAPFWIEWVWKDSNRIDRTIFADVNNEMRIGGDPIDYELGMRVATMVHQLKYQ